MPFDGLIAFCTFYDREPKNDASLTPDGRVASLTTLRFRLKQDAKTKTNKNLVEKFDMVLRNNSMFIIPLSTNQLYTHEIVPPNLPAKQIPTRMGYVIRSSKVVANYRISDGKTYIDAPHVLSINSNRDGVEMVCPKREDVIALKNKYFEENTTSNNVDYGEEKYFSLNNGDYLPPIVR
jgi:hypothetical protein